MKKFKSRLSNSRLGDFWFSHGGKIKFIGQLLVMILSIVVILGLFLGWFESSEESEGTKGLETDIDYSDQYIVLTESETPMMGKYAKEISILIKDPFMVQEEIERISKSIVNNEIERLENSELEEDKDKVLHAMKIDIYHRQVIFDEGLEPRGIVTFQHKDGWVASFEEGIGAGLFGKEYSDHVYDVRYAHMEEVFQKVEGSEEEISTYLNDDEYEIFKEILLYSVLVGSMSIEDGIEPYIVKNYGFTKSDTPEKYFPKEKELEEFLGLARDYGEPMNIYGDNEMYLLEYYKEFDTELYEFITKFY